MEITETAVKAALAKVLNGNTIDTWATERAYETGHGEEDCFNDLVRGVCCYLDLGAVCDADVNDILSDLVDYEDFNGAVAEGVFLRREETINGWLSDCRLEDREDEYEFAARDFDEFGVR